MPQQTTQASNPTSFLPDEQSVKKTPTIAEVIAIDVATIERLARGRTSCRTKADQDKRRADIEDICDRYNLSGPEFDNYATAVLSYNGFESVTFSLHRKAEDFASDVAMS